MKAKVGGKTLDVLIQAFERRVLSYTPSNPAGWQVEMGNVGRHYYEWRYQGRHPGSLSTPITATRIVVPKAKVDSKIIPVYVEERVVGSGRLRGRLALWHRAARPGRQLGLRRAQ